ncbi:MAG: response regulator transcription factor [Anaerolineales bacterium]|nr:response regulator transcription factor [Anaerolineales bacterium]
MNKVRVLLADDHVLFREGLSGIIASQADMQVVGEASDGLEAVIKARELQPDLILMDIQMPGCDGLEATRRIKQEQPATTIVVLTVRDDEEKLFEAIKSGAQGYLLKSARSKEVLEMLRGALRGEAAIPPHLAGRMLEEFRRLSRQATASDEEEDEIPTLTMREQEVLGLVAQGMADKDIAAALSLSLHTVKSHLRNILAKLHVSSRHEAARLARRRGLI